MKLFTLKKLNRDQRGFTLLEMIVAIFIASLVVVAIATTTYQVLAGNARSNSHMTAVRQVQQVGHWMSEDGQMADLIDIENDSATVGGSDILILRWTEYTYWYTPVVGVDPPEVTKMSIKHKVTYNLTDDDRLIRHHYTNRDPSGDPLGYPHEDEYPDIDQFPTLESLTLIAQYITVCEYNQGTNILSVTAEVSGFMPSGETRTYVIEPRID